MCLQSDSSHAEKTGEFAVKTFPEGFVLSWDCPTQMAYAFSFIELRKILCEFHKYRISLSHTVHDREVWGIYKRCRRMVPPQTCFMQVCACPRYEGLFHEDMSIPYPPGIGGKAYHWSALVFQEWAGQVSSKLCCLILKKAAPFCIHCTPKSDGPCSEGYSCKLTTRRDFRSPIT